MSSLISDTVDGKPLRPYSHPATSAAVVKIILQHGLPGKRVLDVGAGQGYFKAISRVWSEPNRAVRAWNRQRCLPPVI